MTSEFDPDSPGDTFNREDLIATFVAECDENLSTLESLLVVLETIDDDGETIDTVFRCAHTLKGNAASVGLESVTRLAHVMEDLLDRVRSNKLEVSRELITGLLIASDAMRRLIPEALSGDDTLDDEALEVMATLTSLVQGEGRESRPAAEETASRARQEEKPSAKPQQSKTAARRIRTDLGRLDRLLNLTGEVVIAFGRTRSRAQALDNPRDREQILECLSDMERLFSDLQEHVTRVRMVPVGAAFEPQKRIVRDLTVNGKEMRLVVEGSEVEVDATVVEQIKAPLTHMIRNSADHGIEQVADRLLAGKDRCGTITLRAMQENGVIVIQVEDDGAGLDLDRIADRARSRGILGPNETLTESEIERLIFLPGLSTVDSVTDTSGRGVGMDVVNRNVAALRGTIDIDSLPGKGSTFTIRVPLTLAVLEGLALEAGGERFVVPIRAIEECIDAPAELSGGRASGVMNLRGTPIPYVRLSQFYRLPVQKDSRENVVIVRCGKEMLGIVADRLLGEMQAVMKPVGRLFRGLAGVSGSTLFGDGRVGLIIDAATLLRDLVKRGSALA